MFFLYTYNIQYTHNIGNLETLHHNVMYSH